jgi:hypothetical protein
MIGDDYFMPNFEPTQVDSSYFTSTVDIRNNKSTNSYCPEVYVSEVTFWKHTESEKYSPDNITELRHNEILNWFNGLDNEKKAELNFGDNVVLGFPVNQVSDFCKRSLSERTRTISISNLENGDGVSTGVQNIEVDVNAASGVDKIEYFLNDSIQYTYTKDVGGSFNGNVRISPSFAEGRDLKITVLLYDEYGYTAETSINVFVGEGNSNNNNGDKPTLSELLNGGSSNNNDSIVPEPVVDLSEGEESIIIE